MAKAILEFDLNDHDDEMAHRRCIKALDMALAIWKILNIKKELEFEFEENELNRFEAMDRVFDKIYEVLEEEVIDIDSLVE